jgi:hypothetical protein
MIDWNFGLDEAAGIPVILSLTILHGGGIYRFCSCLGREIDISGLQLRDIMNVAVCVGKLGIEDHVLIINLLIHSTHENTFAEGGPHCRNNTQQSN